ncbi:MAG: four helix bundle protein [Desulfatirhabdiaceae bacterium]
MRDPSKKFEDLVVWRKAHQFLLAVYRLTQSFPKILEAYMRAILTSEF